MSRTDRFREQHNVMLSLVSELQQLLDEKKLALDASAARKCLSNLIGKLTLHLSTEDSVMYPELTNSKDAELASLAVRFSSEMKSTSAKVKEYNAKWATPTSIKASPAAFISETKQIISVLADRIKRENQQLYAAADKTEGKVFG
jgi:iron-sulfur cluster repair protein YtfE (RIC family)